MEQLSVWMERFEGFALVGTLGFEANGDEWFEYDDSFLRAESSMPIYPVLPLREGRFTSQQTRAAFASLGPEGAVGHDIRTALRAGREAVTPILARLNHETVGALAFGKPGEPLDINRGNPKTNDLDAESGVDAGSFAEKLVADCRPRTEVALRASLLRG